MNCPNCGQDTLSREDYYDTDKEGKRKPSTSYSEYYCEECGWSAIWHLKKFKGSHWQILHSPARL